MPSGAGSKEMEEIERGPRRKMMEDSGPKSPASPPSSRDAPTENGEAEGADHLAIIEAPKDRQDKFAGAMTAPGRGRKESGARASKDESPQQQGPPGTGVSNDKSFQQQGPPGKGAFSGGRFQPRKRTEDHGPRSPAPPPSLRGTPDGASKAKAGDGTRRGRMEKFLAQESRLQSSQLAVLRKRRNGGL